MVTIVSIPIVAALIGWITNAIAVKMIFHPRQPRSILGVRFQGLVPRRQAELARSIAETVEQELVSHRDIQKVLLKTEVQQEMVNLIEAELETFLQAKLASNPLFGMFLQGGMSASIREMFSQQIRQSIPGLLEALVARVEDELNFRDIIEKKILEFDVLKLEAIVMRIASKELKTIEILGGVLGFVVGLVQVAFMYSGMLLGVR